MYLPTQTPFSLRAVIQSHGWAQLPPFHAAPTGRELARIERTQAGRVVRLVMRPAAETGVRVDVTPSVDANTQAELRRKVRWMLDMDADLRAFYTLAREEPKLAHVEPRVQGRILRAPTVFEDLVKTLLTTNTAWTGTRRMVGALVDALGAPHPDAPSRRAFPTPARVAAAGEERLRALGLGYRAPFVADLAQWETEGALDLEALKDPQRSTAELRKALLALRGVGDYAAAEMLMLLGRYDYVPVDSWARKRVSAEWHAGAPIKSAAVEAAFERWGPWKGLAYWFWNWNSQSEQEAS
jgi:3-methyladenine DNA glycosylase/8-oxoguanine DNA glycosylase